MYGCRNCYSVVQVWRYSVPMSFESVTGFFFNYVREQFILSVIPIAKS